LTDSAWAGVEGSDGLSLPSLQPIPENEGHDNQDEKEGRIAAMKGLRCEEKREDSQAE
jgi:hypothetical protein